VSDKIVPIVIQLSGHAQRDDRLAMREIAWQLAQQTGKTFASEDNDEADEGVPEAGPTTLPPPAHLPALISVLPSQARPVVVVLDAFDCFALHGRQALLYCLLDTAQSCRVGEGNNGIAVIGVTTRVDTINLLEKRVKSRFSGRMFRTSGSRTSNEWIKFVRTILTVPIKPLNDEWKQLWEASVERFLADRKVIDSLQETWGLTKDVRVLAQIIVRYKLSSDPCELTIKQATPVLELNPSSPFLSANQIISSIAAQRFPARFSYLSGEYLLCRVIIRITHNPEALGYPSICLLIAAIHYQTAGHDTFTFEMLHRTFRDQVRTSMSAPVQVDGGSIGMVKCSRHTLIGVSWACIAIQ
jgi:origin recognition complex subunit 4